MYDEWRNGLIPFQLSFLFSESTELSFHSSLAPVSLIRLDWPLTVRTAKRISMRRLTIILGGTLSLAPGVPHRILYHTSSLGIPNPGLYRNYRIAPKNSCPACTNNLKLPVAGRSFTDSARPLPVDYSQRMRLEWKVEDRFDLSVRLIRATR